MRFHKLASRKDKGRYIMVKGLLNNKKVTLHIYAPNEGQITFLDMVFHKLISSGEGTILMAGDLNYDSDLSTDRKTF